MREERPIAPPMAPQRRRSLQPVHRGLGGDPPRFECLRIVGTVGLQQEWRDRLHASMPATPMVRQAPCKRQRAARAAATSTAYGNTAAGKTSNGDMYAGHDGNVYKNTGSGWQKYDNGSWNTVTSPPHSNSAELPAAASDEHELQLLFCSTESAEQPQLFCRPAKRRATRTTQPTNRRPKLQQQHPWAAAVTTSQQWVVWRYGSGSPEPCARRGPEPRFSQYQHSAADRSGGWGGWGRRRLPPLD